MSAANPIYRMTHPRTVADLAAVLQSSPGLALLAPRRADREGRQALVTALGGADPSVEVEWAADGTVVVRYAPASIGEAALLASPVPDLPLPPARIDVSEPAAATPEAVWRTLTGAGGPPWRPPALVRVTPLVHVRPAWRVEVAVGPWMLPHRMEQTTDLPTRTIELCISGKLNALARYDLEPAGDGCRVRHRLWFAIDGGAIEAAVGELLIEGLARRYAAEHLRAVTGAAERA